MKSFENMSLEELEAMLETAKKEFTRLYMEGKSETLAFNLAEREYQAILWYVAGINRGLSEAGRS